jgi:hypothetical protein
MHVEAVTVRPALASRHSVPDGCLLGRSSKRHGIEHNGKRFLFFSDSRCPASGRTTCMELLTAFA